MMDENKIIESMARVICVTSGLDPDRPIDIGAYFRGEPQWRLFGDEARAACDVVKAGLAEASMVIAPQEANAVLDAALKMRHPKGDTHLAIIKYMADARSELKSTTDAYAASLIQR